MFGTACTFDLTRQTLLMVDGHDACMPNRFRCRSVEVTRAMGGVC